MNPWNLSRRQFVWTASCAITGGCMGLPATLVAGQETGGWDPKTPFPPPAGKLRLKPVFMYSLPTPREASSWKSWGGVQTAAAVTEECGRIEAELGRLRKQAEFGLEVLPLARVSNLEAAKQLSGDDWDVTLVYACTGGGDLLRACLELKRDTLVFVRHRSGPIYYWYEALSTRYLEAGSAANSAGGSRPHVDDVVVDEYAEVLWKLRALHAVKNLRGTRIVALGGAWGKYAPDAPEKARERYGLEILDVSYEDFGPRVRRALGDPGVIRAAEQEARRYLALPRTRLETERRYVVNAFVLYRLFKDLMREREATAFTIKSCMGTILPMAQTTACLTLSLLNDEGAIAFCESDFVIIPAGLLMRHIVNRPVFLHNSTFPHQGMVTCAHCTSPRRMDGRRYEPVRVVTHYESEYGAATKVDMPVGREVTFLDPEYSTTRWVGLTGIVKANPFYDICRSQQDVQIRGRWKKLLGEARDSHWVMAYGNWMKELGYAARKIGIEWVSLEETV